MNNFVLQVDPPTPPRKTRRSLTSITSVHEHTRTPSFSLRLPSEVNPPEMLVNASDSTRIKTHTNLLPKFSTLAKSSKRRDSSQHYKSQRNKDLPEIFPYSHNIFLKTNTDRSPPKLKREFDSYLTFIKSGAVGFSVAKLKKPHEASLNIEVARTIQFLFLKLSEAIESSPSNAKNLCIVYLSLYEKSLVEFSVSRSLDQPTLNKLFVTQRLICYYLVILFGSNKFELYCPLFVKASCNFYSYFEAIINLVGKSHKAGIGSTIKNLKLLCEIDKGCGYILDSLKSLAKPLSRELYQAEKQLMHLMDSPQSTNFIDKLIKVEYSLNWKLLRLPPIPFLPPSPSSTLTVILQLDYTLVFFNDERRSLMFRPYLQDLMEFLKGNNIQIVLFTVSPKEYADKVVEEVDPEEKFFEARLYNEHINVMDKELVKDLSKLGRDLGRVVAIDSLEVHYRKHSENILHVDRWFGRQDDQDLRSAITTLKGVLNASKTADIRPLLRPSKPLLTHISEQAEETIQSLT